MLGQDWAKNRPIGLVAQLVQRNGLQIPTWSLGMALTGIARAIDDKVVQRSKIFFNHLYTLLVILLSLSNILDLRQILEPKCQLALALLNCLDRCVYTNADTHNHL